jgi:site-specific DNA-methyltransferase (adenine-specific)
LFPNGAKPRHSRQGKRGGSGFGFFDDKKSANADGFWPADSGGSAARFFYSAKVSKKERDAGMDDCETISAGECTGGRKEGSAGLDNPRAGAGRTSGAKNNHPTVKPIALMRYLCKLITPSNGTILDPFLGSGSTGIGATLEGFDFIGIELSPEYLAIAQKRIDYWKKEEEKKDPQTLMF